MSAGLVPLLLDRAERVPMCMVSDLVAGSGLREATHDKGQCSSPGMCSRPAQDDLCQARGVRALGIVQVPAADNEDSDSGALVRGWQRAQPRGQELSQRQSPGDAPFLENVNAVNSVPVTVWQGGPGERRRNAANPVMTALGEDLGNECPAPFLIGVTDGSDHAGEMAGRCTVPGPSPIRRPDVPFDMRDDRVAKLLQPGGGLMGDRGVSIEQAARQAIRRR